MLLKVKTFFSVIWAWIIKVWFWIRGVESVILKKARIARDVKLAKDKKGAEANLMVAQNNRDHDCGECRFPGK
jgi:hypothetical protein